MPRVKGNPWVTLVILCLGFFMTLLDTTIVNIALPSMSHDLGANLDDLIWVISVYVFGLGVLIITAGGLGAIVGPRNVFIAGLVLFTAASAACGASQSPGQLIAARAVQGVGAALMTPQTLTLLMAIFPPDKRAVPSVIWGFAAGVAGVAGPTVGGLLVTHWSWRWIFYVNVPVGVITLIAAILLIPDLRVGQRRRLDLLGVALVSLALFAITFALVEGEHYDWGTVRSFVTIPGLIVTGVVLLGLFIVSQAYRKDPLMPLELFRNRDFSIMSFVGLVLSFTLVAAAFGLTIYLQSMLGLSALSAGLTIAPSSLAIMAGFGIVGALGKWVKEKQLVIGGFVLNAIAIADIAHVTRIHASRWDFLPGLIMLGLAQAAIFSPLVTVAVRDVPTRLSAAASGAFNAIRQIGFLLAAAAVGALLERKMAGALHHEAVAQATRLPADARAPFVSAFDELARSGLQVGSGSAGTQLRFPAGIAPATLQQMQNLSGTVVAHAFIDALRFTLYLVIGACLLAGVVCIAIKKHHAEAQGDEDRSQLDPITF
ncbi:DHA2 family efflux MFS transporter permease subunit [Actinoallomurus iriomotensis]|uniref:MFS transporter n=1 Tax=Actinoallomurus iriomotensis TaxID=478107 RepID=A0A9W6VQH8_9ACTN|nr:DHA2 family efflux MFS transporter permease subunit [Actinoallomurus iriomotensis]GLY75487.1 MFS transporter [Actinoallomurus iriomotensis]